MSRTAECRCIVTRLTSLLLVASVTGCTALTPIAPGRESLQRQVRVGDRLELVTVSGDSVEGTVREMTADRIVFVEAEGQRRVIAYSDVAVVQRRRPALGRTIGLALGITAAVVVIQLRSGDDLLRFPGAPTGQ